MEPAPVLSDSKRNFVLQQGFDDPPPGVEPRLFSALVFQPKIVGSAILAGMTFRSPAVLAGIAAALAWSALLPRRNPFDLLYNRTRGKRTDAVSVPPAPPPRRFAQGLAASLALASAASFRADRPRLGFAFALSLLAAVAAIVFGRFCFGSFVWHHLRGGGAYARKTAPWGPGAPNKSSEEYTDRERDSLVAE